jgi:hypothetical protein
VKSGHVHDDASGYFLATGFESDLYPVVERESTRDLVYPRLVAIGKEVKILFTQFMSRTNRTAKSVNARMRKHLLRVCFAGVICMGSTEALTGNRSTATGSAAPILVELFTSEGCSTCPPADVTLDKMDTLQPVPGAQLIVLSEHVDYWNHDGWTDPYSSASITGRQNSYVHALGLKTAYTPQIFIDGTAELRLGDPAQATQIFQKAVSVSKVPISITSATIEGNKPAIVQGTIEAESGPAEQHNADVFVAVALDHAESQVSSGENRGKHLVHVAVVMEMVKVGKLEKGKNFHQDFRVKLNLPHAASTNIRIVAFIQETGPGRVLGASLRKVEMNP